MAIGAKEPDETKARAMSSLAESSSAILLQRHIFTIGLAAFTAPAVASFGAAKLWPGSAHSIDAAAIAPFAGAFAIAILAATRAIRGIAFVSPAGAFVADALGAVVSKGRQRIPSVSSFTSSRCILFAGVLLTRILRTSTSPNYSTGRGQCHDTSHYCAVVRRAHRTPGEAPGLVAG